MAIINADNREAWQSLANSASKEKPFVGRKVRIDNGRKHKGKIGEVMRHQQDKFWNAFRYGSPAQHMLTQMRGREGFVILVKTQTEQFWVKAEYATVLEA